MTIAAVLRGKGNAVATIPSQATVSEAIAELGAKRIGALPVVDSGRLVGIISERDVIYCLRDRGAPSLNMSVGEVMTAPVITATGDMEVLDALGLMTERRIRHLPITQGEELRGIVSIGDLVKHRMDRIEAEAEAMRSYIQSA